MTSPTIQRPPVKISAAGLTKPGVAVLQFLIISLFVLIELTLRHGIGILTGLAICAVVLGGMRFGRTGTAYICAVTPPIAFATFLLSSLVLIDGLHPSRVGLDFIASLASAAPYRMIGSALAWLNYFKNRR